MEGQQPAKQPDAPINTSLVSQTKDNVANFYDNILTMPTLPD
jgi:hypothetical protein